MINIITSLMRGLILFLFSPAGVIYFFGQYNSCIYANKMTRRLSLNPNLSDMISNLAADRNGLDSVAALLDIDGDRRAPSNSNILDRSSSRSRMAGPTSVEDEVRSLFRGPSPNFISQTLYMALAEGIASIQPTPNEICDYELREQVEALLLPMKRISRQLFFKAIELINLAGCMSLTLHFNQDGQTTLVKSLTKFVVCDRIQSPFEQFENGLQTMGLVDEIKKKNKKQWKQVFIFTIKPLDALQLDNMFDVKWSTEGSNRKRIEERILVYWRDFLQDLEEGQGEVSVTLKDLLAFTTGADEVPELGFNFPLQLSFIHPEDLQDVAQCYTAGFPYANTCTMELKIPVVNDYNTFQRDMAAAISMTVTFTNQ